MSQALTGRRVLVVEDESLVAMLLETIREVFPIAEALKARGVPFIFSTGYGEGGLPDAWRGQATVQKPFTESAIRDALLKAMGMEEA